jgi:dipeptidyl aminopeptidase/acylaminoacyl peptidase
MSLVPGTRLGAYEVSATVSAAGSLAYYWAPSTNTLAAWYDADGKHIADLSLPPGHYETVSISPDGERAVVVKSTSASESALWLVNLARGGASQLSLALAATIRRSGLRMAAGSSLPRIVMARRTSS